jgi:hypothetical protein
MAEFNNSSRFGLKVYVKFRGVGFALVTDNEVVVKRLDGFGRATIIWM